MPDLVSLAESALCAVCGHRVWRGVQIDGVVVGWCDLDWQRYIVRWSRDLDTTACGGSK